MPAPRATARAVKAVSVAAPSAAPRLGHGATASKSSRSSDFGGRLGEIADASSRALQHVLRRPCRRPPARRPVEAGRPVRRTHPVVDQRVARPGVEGEQRRRRAPIQVTLATPPILSTASGRASVAAAPRGRAAPAARPARPPRHRRVRKSYDHRDAGQARQQRAVADLPGAAAGPGACEDRSGRGSRSGRRRAPTSGRASSAAPPRHAARVSSRSTAPAAGRSPPRQPRAAARGTSSLVGDRQ